MEIKLENYKTCKTSREEKVSTPNLNCTNRLTKTPVKSFLLSNRSAERGSIQQSQNPNSLMILDKSASTSSLLAKFQGKKHGVLQQSS